MLQPPTTLQLQDPSTRPSIILVCGGSGGSGDSGYCVVVVIIYLVVEIEMQFI